MNPSTDQNVQTKLDQVAHSVQFRKLLKQKKNFIVPASIFFFVFYFTLPIFTAYTDFLNRPILGALTIAWLFAFAQFVMTWVLCILYTRKAKQFDQMVEEIVKAEAVKR